MATLNKVLLIGALTHDVELRITPKGTAIAQLALAMNRNFKDGDGTSREETTFVDVEVWGKQAELTAKYTQKGSAVFIEGRLRLDSWEEKDTGKKRHKLKVVAENIQWLGAPPRAQLQAQEPAEPAVHEAPVVQSNTTGVDNSTPF